MKNNCALVEWSFSLPRDNDLKRHILQTGDFSSRKRHLQKDCSVLLERLVWGTANACGTRLQGTGSWIHVTHLEKSSNLTGPWHHLGACKQRFPRMKADHIWQQSFLSLSGPGLYTLSAPFASTISFLERKCSCAHIPTLVEGRNLLITAFQQQPHHDPMTFNYIFTCFFWRVTRLRIYQCPSFICTIFWFWILIQISGFWICNLTGCITG